MAEHGGGDVADRHGWDEDARLQQPERERIADERDGQRGGDDHREQRVEAQARAEAAARDRRHLGLRARLGEQHGAREPRGEAAAQHRAHREALVRLVRPVRIDADRRERGRHHGDERRALGRRGQQQVAQPRPHRITTPSRSRTTRVSASPPPASPAWSVRQHRAARCRALAQRPGEPAPTLLVEPGERLVEQQQRWRGAQRLDQRDALEHALAQSRSRAVEHRGRQPGGGRVGVPALTVQPPQRAHRIQPLARPHGAGQHDALWHERDRPVPSQRARRRSGEPREDAQQARLPRPVRAAQVDDLARPETRATPSSTVLAAAADP